MSFIDAYYNKFNDEYPDPVRTVDGVVVSFSDDEREALYWEWANNSVERGFREIRFRRDGLLKASDWTQMPDAPVDREAWAKYRQTLRDFPETITTIDALDNPVWPTPPA